MIRPKLVSVIIPTYNNARFLIEAIRSALDQTYPNLEIIVINNGSTDNTDEIAKNYLDRIIYIKQNNAGPASARNTGIRRAKGEYIAFLDADDNWIPTKIEEQMKVFSETPDIALVYSQMAQFDNLTGKELFIWPDKIYSGRVFGILLEKNFILLSSVIIQTSIIKNVGAFDNSLITAEDTNLFLKVAKNHEIIGMEQVMVRRRKHGTNISDRMDVTIGTLDNLDKIVALFPETHPGIYPAMKKAYHNRIGERNFYLTIFIILSMRNAMMYVKGWE